jgi:AcrR family transcriptional regulator
LAALREGETFAAAAQRAGVERAAVYRWVQSDSRFQAAYHLWQQELANSARVRLLELADKAIKVFERALAQGDEQVALRMLCHTGMIRRPQTEAHLPQDETTDPTGCQRPQVASYPPEPEQEPQMIKGWRIGTKLYAAP